LLPRPLNRRRYETGWVRVAHPASSAGNHDPSTQNNTHGVEMKNALPDIDPYTVVSNPLAQRQFNELLIEQFRANAGQLTGQFAAFPILLLTTVGAKTRSPRTTPLVYLQDDDRYIVIASMAGAPRNPAWYHNLLANPTASVELANESFDVRARIAEGDARHDLYETVARRFPIYGEYQQKTGRLVPVIVLQPLTG
jgi:deazaflavin-dependent oxidoreductase (nitroreductase family)